jgi:hypothetical protein
MAFSIVTWSQSNPYMELKNHNKYWVFRNRLKTRFLSAGARAGQSIPAGRLHNPIQNEMIGPDEPAMAEFGDATIYLGWYISVLATENILLRAHNQNTSENEMELFYALNAINRLDYNSGVIYSYITNTVNIGGIYLPYLPYYGTPPSQILFNNFSNNNFFYPGNDIKSYPANFDFNTENWIPNPSNLNLYAQDGYFIRDDVPPYFEQKLSNIIGVQSDITRGVQYVGPHNAFTLSNIDYHPDYQWRPYAGFYYPRAEESQDQLYSIMMGLRFVSAFIPPNINVVHNGNTINLIALNKQITKSITNYVKSKTWKIPNPHTNAMPANGGGDMSLFAYGFATTANKILFDKNFYASPWQIFIDNSPPTMHDFFSISYQNAILSLFPNYYIPFQDRVTEYLASIIGAISNCLRPSLPVNSNSVEILLSRGIPYQWNIYALINHALFPTSNITSNALILGQMLYVKNDLSKCPCEGPYNFGPYNNQPGYVPPVEGWFASNKWQFKQSDYWNTESEPYQHSTGRFNALDYMLYYNLYRILYANFLTNVPYQKIDKIEFNCQTIIPYLTNQYTSVFNSQTYASGNNTNPIREYAISQIQSGATLLGQSNPSGAANVEYRAGESVKLKTCFKVERGAYFKAYVAKGIECDKFNYRSSLTDTDNEFAALKIKHFMDSLIDKNENAYYNYEDSLSSNRNNLSSNKGLFLYPNPSTDVINIEFTYEIQKIEIINAKGQIIQTVRCSKDDRNASINLHTHERGIYFAIIYTDFHKNETIKFILI